VRRVFGDRALSFPVIFFIVSVFHLCAIKKEAKNAVCLSNDTSQGQLVVFFFLFFFPPV
jgi:hypothetical protein